MPSIHNRSDKVEKIVFLSLLSADHSKQKIAELLNFSKRQDDKLKKWKKVSENLSIAKAMKYTWLILDKEKNEEHPQFLFRYALFHDKAFEITKLQYVGGTECI